MKTKITDFIKLTEQDNKTHSKIRKNIYTKITDFTKRVKYNNKRQYNFLIKDTKKIINCIKLLL